MSAITNLLIGFAIGGILCFIIGWLLASRRRPVAPADSRLEEELRSQLSQRESELPLLRTQLAKAVEQNVELNTQLKYLNERLTTERQQIETLQQKFQKDFESVSNKLLLASSSHFNKQSSENLEQLLSPLKIELKDFKAKLDNSQKETATHTALLKDQIGRIGTEAANLSKALKGDAKVLGNWGENMLEQILEKSGLERGLHYRRQSGAKDLEGDQRFLDVIVELPEGRNLVIDSKVSLRAYEEAANTIEDAAKLVSLDRHVEALRKHFRDLGAKRYHDIHGISSPDFVLMYVPVESAFFAAIARAPGLFAQALDHNVVIITNSTLLATLRTVAHVWKLVDQQKHVLEIADRGAKLYDKFVGFIVDLNAVGDGLKDAQKAWDEATKKLEIGRGNLISQAEELKRLGAKASKSLPPQLIERADESHRLPPSDATSQVPSRE